MQQVPEGGIYVLVILARGMRTVAAGALGELRLEEGCYAYVGRAKRGLPARLARHARSQGKRLHWHVDYLLGEARLEEVWVFPLHTGECELARRLEAEGGSRGSLGGFGSSDCRCPGHLLYLGRARPRPPGDAVAVISHISRENNA